MKKEENMNLKNKHPGSFRWWDPFTGFVLICALITSATRLGATRWTEDLNLTQTVVFLGGIAGLAIGQSRFRRLTAGIFALVYGSFVVPWQLGSTLGIGIEWKERLLSLMGRLQVILHAISLREPVTDNLFFILLMTILYWTLGVQAGYSLTRIGDPWRVLLPTGLTTFVIDTFDPLLERRAWYLAVYIFLSLILIARTSYLRLRARWEDRGMHFPQDVGYDLSRFTIITSLVVVLLAWNVPSLANSLPAISNFYSTIRTPYLNAKERASFLFAALQASVGMVSDYYGEQQALGTGTPKTDTILMEVDAPSFIPDAPRYYWRARVYDFYENGVWSTTNNARRKFLPEETGFQLVDTEERVEGTFVFRLYRPIISLYATPQPIWFSRSGQIQYSLNEKQVIDLVGIRADPYIRPGEQYQVRSRLSTVTIKQMREAGTVYPEWITERYLQIPKTVSPRTGELARQIAAGYNNSYDIAQAITEWLRINIQYAEVISAPPRNREILDWFLFDYRKGFCNYYATAEIVLLRSLGIPARWAVGYAQGERLSQSPGQGRGAIEDAGVDDIATYTVRERDAHAWPEVFFPGIGWVEFEPTVSQLPLFRPPGEELPQSGLDDELQADLRALNRDLPQLDDAEQLPPDANTKTGTQGIPSNVLVSISILVLALVIGLIAIFARRRQITTIPFWVRIIGGDEALLAQWQSERVSTLGKLEQGFALIGRRIEHGMENLGIHSPEFLRAWTYHTLLPTISRAYQEINRALERMGRQPSKDTTPAERGAQLVEIIPEAEIPVTLLVKEYQTASYSLYAADIEKARMAADTLRKLSFLARLKKYLSKFQEMP